LQEIGDGGAYDSVQRLVKRWKSTQQGPKLTEAFVPLLILPGDACPFDWSHEQVELGGVLQTIKVVERLKNPDAMDWHSGVVNQLFAFFDCPIKAALKSIGDRFPNELCRRIVLSPKGTSCGA